MFDEFTTAYMECIAWTGVDEDGTPWDESGYDFSAEAIEIIREDCAKFQLDNHDLISKNLSVASHDFWLTRNGHGAGFNDGHWGDDGEVLAGAAKGFGEQTAYIGDDGLIYLL